MEETISRIAVDPDRGRFRSGLVVADDSEADGFKLSGYVVANGAAFVLGADQDADFDRLTFVLPHTIDQGCAQGFHFSRNRFVGLFRVVGVLGLQRTDHIGHQRVVTRCSVEGDVAGRAQATHDLLGDVIAVDEPVHGLAHRRHGEGIQLARAFKDRTGRVEAQFIVGTR